MALSPTNNAALLQEVDEAVRQDQLGTMWRRYGRLLIGLVVAGLIAFAGWLYWGHRQDVARGEEAEKLLAGFDKVKAGDAKGADAALAAIASTGSPAYRAMAVIQQANLKAEAGDSAGAATLLAKLAADDKADPVLRDLALVRQTALELDRIKPAEVIARMQPMIDATDPVSPWFASAAELAAIAHYRNGAMDKAGALYARIAKEKDLPKSLQSRSVQMAGMLGVDAVDDPGARTAGAKSKQGATQEQGAAAPQTKDAPDAK